MVVLRGVVQALAGGALEGWACKAGLRVATGDRFQLAPVCNFYVWIQIGNQNVKKFALG